MSLATRSGGSRRVVVLARLTETLAQAGMRPFEIRLTFWIFAQPEPFVEQADNVELMAEKVVLPI